jgi:DNA-binding transcriptional ArsR family regulator
MDGTKEVAKRRSVSAALGHPLRVRILEVLNDRDMSPVQFFRENLAPAEGNFGLSGISHHFKELRKSGCLEVVDTIPRRGSVEHVYRGVARATFTDHDWARKLTPEQRSRVTRTVLQGLMARADGAIMAETFDNRIDRHLSWIAMEMDEQGWSALTALQWETLQKAEAIREEAAERIADSGESFPVTFGSLSFESPPSQ